jgi:hypothetical protein
LNRDWLHYTFVLTGDDNCLPKDNESNLFFSKIFNFGGCEEEEIWGEEMNNNTIDLHNHLNFLHSHTLKHLHSYHNFTAEYDSLLEESGGGKVHST